MSNERKLGPRLANAASQGQSQHKLLITAALCSHLCLHNCVAFSQTLIARPCHSSGGQSPASHSSGQGPTPCQVTWDLLAEKVALWKAPFKHFSSLRKFPHHQPLHIHHASSQRYVVSVLAASLNKYVMSLPRLNSLKRFNPRGKFVDMKLKQTFNQFIVRVVYIFGVLIISSRERVGY
jgi:hypothetical protein